MSYQGLSDVRGHESYLNTFHQVELTHTPFKGLGVTGGQQRCLTKTLSLEPAVSQGKRCPLFSKHIF